MRTRLIPAAAAIASAFLAPASCFAQDAMVEELPLTESALPAQMLAPTGMRQPIRDIPATVVILPATLLSNYGFISITEALRSLGGIAPRLLGWSGYDLRIGRKATAGPPRLIVLIDGIEVDASLLNATNLSALPVGIDDVERIEISSGPSTAGYGHALAAAIINIVTKHPADVERAYGRLTTGTHDANTVFGRAGATFGPTSVRLALTHNQRGPIDENSTVTARAANLTLDRVTLRTSTRFDNVGTLEVDAAYLNGHSSGAFADSPSPDADTHNGYASARWTANPSASDEISIRFDHWFDDQALESSSCGNVLAAGAPFAPDAAAQTDVVDDLVADAPGRKAQPASCLYNMLERRTIAQLQDVHVVGDGLRFVGGVGGRMELVRNAVPNAGQPWAANYLRAYGGADWRVTPTVTLNAGASSDHASSTNYDTSVRAGVNWHLSDDQTLRSALTYGRWASDANQTLGVSGLVITSEKMTTADLGYLLDLPARNASVTTRLYWQRLDGQVANFAPGTAARDAYGDIYGVEGRATADLASCCSGFLNLSYSAEGPNSGFHRPGTNWVTEGSIGMSAYWGAGWRTSAAWYATSNDAANGIAVNTLALALIKDFTWFGSRTRVTLMGRHGSNAIESSQVFASLTLAY